MKILPLALLIASLPVSLHAQTIDDGILVATHQVFTGDLYSHDSWDEYWEGTLKRVNGNIGTITTHTDTWFATYGLTDRLNVIASVPYVWTRPSQGVLHGMRGFQDIALAGKYRVFDARAPKGSLRAIAVAAAGIPLTDYTPDFYPLSIGSASRRVSGRLTLNYQSNPGWYLNGSGAYTWRRHVTLDRPYYYTDGQLFLTSDVDMPNVADYVVSAGYLKRGLNANVSWSQQRTRGGGDIRRQDSPFVSNRMNFSKAGAMVMYPVPKIPSLAFEFALARTMNGRNVGQATTFTTGLAYTHHAYGKAGR